MKIKYGSVCSGIEAATVAWHSLGWEAAWLSEIEAFPSAVLAHHYPDVPNLGDMTKITPMILDGSVEAPDVFVGGTPCQAFSVAGLRNSLEDDRGQLSITYIHTLDAIDIVRQSRGEQPCIAVWENVPGVLSTKDNAFGCFLAGLSGEDDALLPPRGKWTNAGCVVGPKRTVAWRVLDAQYFGVAQRRRRVFVVASAREDFSPPKVLFEFEGMRRDTPPSREKGKATAKCLTSRAGSGGGFDLETETPVIANTIAARTNDAIDVQSGTFIPSMSWPAEVASTLDTTYGTKQGLENQHVNAGCPLFVPSAVAYSFDSLASNYMKSANPHSGCREVDVAKTLDTSNGLDPSCNQGGNAVEPMHDIAPCLTNTDRHGVVQPIAFKVRCGCEGGGKGFLGSEETAFTLSTTNDQHIAQPIGAFKTLTSTNHAEVNMGMQVRRLTPVECERLQGFPDGYTNIPWRGKDESPDGPRYKALGNSMAVPVMKWIGERIQMVEDLCKLP